MHIRGDSNDALLSSQRLDPLRQGQDQGQGENFVLDFPRYDSFQKKALISQGLKSSDRHTFPAEQFQKQNKKARISPSLNSTKTAIRKQKLRSTTPEVHNVSKIGVIQSIFYWLNFLRDSK